MESTSKRKVFLFAFVNEISQDEKTKLDRIVKSLGAISRINEDMYVSDSTHIVIPDKITEKNNTDCVQ